MKVCLLAGGEPRSVRDLSRRFRDRGLDVRYVWEHRQNKFPEQLPASVEVVVNLRDTCRHAVSAHSDELVRRARAAGRDVAYVITSRRAAKWEAALDAAGFKVSVEAAVDQKGAIDNLLRGDVKVAGADGTQYGVDYMLRQFAEPVGAQLEAAPPPLSPAPASEPASAVLEPASAATNPPTPEPAPAKEQENMPKHNKQHKSPRPAFTAQEELEIKELLLAGERALDVAEGYGCSDWMVYNVAKKYGIQPRQIKRAKTAKAKAAKVKAAKAEKAVEKAVAPVVPPPVAPLPPLPPVLDYPLPPIQQLAPVTPVAPVEKPTDEEWAYLKARREEARKQIEREREKPSEALATCTQADLARARWLVDGVALGLIKVV